MTYLSCIDLDLEESGARRWLIQPYQIHQRLLHAWPDGEAGRVLYRVEADRRPARILVKSPAPADWDRCFADFQGLHGTPRQKPIDLSFREGQVLRFFLRANPTVRQLQFDQESVTPEKRPTGERVALVREIDQVSWLGRKAREAGFAILAVETRDRGDQVSFKASSRQRLTHRCVEFEGRLQVTEPARLLEAVADGIGAGKAFGFGLLSVAPVRESC